MASESRPAPISDVLSKEALLARLDNDPGLLGDVIDLFLKHSPNAMTQLRVAMTQQDAAITHWAHTLKGMVANFETGRALAAVTKMEALGRAGDVASAVAALPQLETEMSALFPAITKIRSELGSE
jgi:HPt (histidine-containing phosphotransfer) domain-containing protein